MKRDFVIIIGIVTLLLCVLVTFLATRPEEPDIPTPNIGSPTPSATHTSTPTAALPTQTPSPEFTATAVPPTQTLPPTETEPPPTETAAPPTETPPPSPTLRPQTWRVRPRDNLSDISEELCGVEQWRWLHNANPWIPDPNLIFAGWTLAVPWPCWSDRSE